MVYITYPKFNDAVVHKIAERYYAIHKAPKILLCYIITRYHYMLPKYLKENQPTLKTTCHFFYLPLGLDIFYPPIAKKFTRFKGGYKSTRTQSNYNFGGIISRGQKILGVKTDEVRNLYSKSKCIIASGS